MAKGKFADIGQKSPAKSQDDFISGAKVDGEAEPKASSRTRRGSSMTDPVTGKKIRLRGKVLEIPLSEAEYQIFRQAAEDMGLPVATYVRSTIIGINRGR